MGAESHIEKRFMTQTGPKIVRNTPSNNKPLRSYLAGKIMSTGTDRGTV